MELTGSIAAILERKGSRIWSIAPTASVFEAVQLMAERDLGALAVIEDGQLTGVISERDYARKIILQGKSSRHTPVAEVMTQPALTVDPGDTVDECMRLMTSHRTRHVFAMRGGKLCGVVSIGDLVNSIISKQAETIGHLNSYIAGNYPA